MDLCAVMGSTEALGNHCCAGPVADGDVCANICHEPAAGLYSIQGVLMACQRHCALLCVHGMHTSRPSLLPLLIVKYRSS